MRKKKTDSEPFDISEAIKTLEGIEKEKGIPLGDVPSLDAQKGILTPKAECKARMVIAMQRGLERYYKRFPDRDNDDRAVEAAKWSLAGLKFMFLILDDYAISFKGTGPDGVDRRSE